MTLQDRILEKLQVQGVAMDDDDLAARLGVVRQAVNQVCRRLEQRGYLDRYTGPNGKIVNRLRPSDRQAQPVMAQSSPMQEVSTTLGDLLSEDEVKAAVKAHLEASGYSVEVAWARERGVDLDARGAGGRIVIEAKGEVRLQPQQVNYFLGALGELVQRMDDPDARYALALPDNRQYRGLVNRLPRLAVERLKLSVFFVGRTEHGTPAVLEERFGG